METVALLESLDNPAIDGGVESVFTTNDARGVERRDLPGVVNTGGTGFDIGAYEVEDVDAPAPTLTVEVNTPVDLAAGR